MANMSLKKNEMPTQEAHVRAHNFDEVALGYTEAMAIDEAQRCLNCKNMPCVGACPVNIRIPEFIEKVKEGDFESLFSAIYTVRCNLFHGNKSLGDLRDKALVQEAADVLIDVLSYRLGHLNV